MDIKGLLNISAIVLMALTTSSCEKDDKPVALPEQGETEHAQIVMGEDYKDQVFFDFATGAVVHMSEINSWDIAFDASPDGFHVFMNGGGDVSFYNTHTSDMTKVTSAPSIVSKEWMYDRPCGLGDSTALGDWRKGDPAKHDVIIAKLNSTYGTNNLKKFKLLTVSPTEYVMEYADLNESATHIIKIPKDDNYNYSYFSFSEGGRTIQPDPPKNTYDIVFTRYRFIFYDMEDYPYIVTGVLTNPYKTLTAAADTTKKYADLNGPEILEMDYSNHRDVIGYSWKRLLSTYRYAIDQNKTYVVKNRRGEYWKLHFLDFYDQQGRKGSPSFEYQRMY